MKFLNVNHDGSKAQADGFVDTDWPVFRSADAYLMYAECAARGAADKTKGQTYLNAIRARAGLGDLALSLDNIIDERGRELYYEGSLALGACKERSVFFAELPAAKSGIIAGIILGVGRAVGETMAVIMVAGNQAVMPRGLVKGIRTLTANIVLEMGYAAGLHREALIATSVVLFFFILIINFVFMMTKKKA